MYPHRTVVQFSGMQKHTSCCHDEYIRNKHKAKKISPQITIPEIGNNEDPKMAYIDLIYMGSRKRQGLLRINKNNSNINN